MPAPRILISGASIAGPALAHWLNLAGWTTTIVERFEGLRDAGQNIDVRGAAREVIRRMGVEDAVFATASGEQGTEIVDERGRTVASFPKTASAIDGATAELEILRGELSRVIVETTQPATEYIFGDQITGLDDRGDRVDVTFRHGAPRSFDVVVIAEGLTSRTRSMVMPDAQIKHLGLYLAYLTIPRAADDTDWWRWHTVPGRRAVTVRPDNFGTIRATLAFMSDTRGLADLSRPDQTAILRRRFAGVGWVAPRILDGLDAAPYYFDAVGQVRIARWSRGRVGLVGDAAYCPAPLSGMGTSLALVGAYVLAAELATAPGPGSAFDNFERRMRPYVAAAQTLPPGVPGVAYPRTRAGVTAMRMLTRAAASPAARRLALADRLSSRPADKITLPDFFPGRRRTAGDVGAGAVA
ncbi:FAD-dependent monooxygenase [Mangrovihabitans endophyticus]|uniref:FAD-binding monooxygenase n=1 Tax=Mangrovihabitans endophyticus TaxID=1751298 RepID=A0A8J3BWE0_9ACTN|nr:FAD-dependent monooxygenase [Mangrovihabitans endophyticus]GGK73708.1 FAD-binding monooxygenase [Mangrovihabitans endophyticus]